MKERIAKILKDFKENKIPASKIESELEIGNGLLGKAAKGTTKLSDEKMKLLEAYYEKNFVTAMMPLKPVDVNQEILTKIGIEALQIEIDKTLNENFLLRARVDELEMELKKENKPVPPSSIPKKSSMADFLTGAGYDIAHKPKEFKPPILKDSK